MKVLGTRFLRGPNIHRPAPCVLALLDVRMPGGGLPTDVNERLRALLANTEDTPDATDATDAQPGADAPAADSFDAADIAACTAQLVRALQWRAGGAAGFACALPPDTAGPPGQRRIVFGYQSEAVAEAALVLAVRLLNAAAAGQPFDLQPALAALRAKADARAIDAGSAALLDAARAHGVPVLRLEDDKRLFQLGWGVHQRRHEAAAPGAAVDPPPTLDALFPGGHNGRIPLVAVTGTNGKTTTTQLIAHAMRASGACTGNTTTQGVFIDGRRVQQGDCTGYWSARSVLTNNAVQTAVLESARGGILKRGLAFDRCDVGVVLNVSSDHLGLDGVHTVADLAHVKGLIARVASKAAVLNAEDPHCVAMRGTLRDGCQPVFFAMDAQQPVLRQHLAAGGSGAWLSADGWLTWGHAGQATPVVAAAHLPFTLNGHARYNVANALAALAALCCMGQVPAAVGAALACFVSDAVTNPLRANEFDVGGVRLIVDYAHNVAACRALCDAARSVLQGSSPAPEKAPEHGRLLGVITAPGDRRAEDLFATGQVCGAGFDELVVYEQNPRGRGAGETTQAILAGARSAAPAKPLHGEPQIRQALARGLSAARPGDVLVFTCAGSLDDVVAGVRLFDPAAAEHVARQVQSDFAPETTAPR